MTTTFASQTRSRDVEPEAARAKTSAKRPADARLHALGNLEVQRLYSQGAIRATLAISQPGDPDEQEADLVAEQVMRMAEPAPISSVPSTIQRKCAACEASGVTCPKCEEEERVQRKEKPGHMPLARPDVHSQISALRGGGQPLAPSVRAFFEPRFGRDFSGVRVHTGGQAAESARAIQARAFTAGQDVVFGAEEYAPGNREGRKLLAHELAHVVQQQNGLDPAQIRRQIPETQLSPSGATPPSPSEQNAPATTPDVGGDLVEKEEKAFDAAKRRVGQAAATVLFSNPVSPETMDSPEFEIFSIAEVIDRHSGDPTRHGFDAQGPATAYTALMGGAIGGAVLKQDKFFFAAKLNKGRHDLRAGDPSWSEFDWWFGRDYVYRVTASPGVVGITGKAGFVFPLGKDLMDDPGTTRFLNAPNTAAPADAKSMRSIAGLGPNGEMNSGPSHVSNQVNIPEEQQEAFILSYFRARGAEILGANEALAERLAKDFKPTSYPSAGAPGEGVSSNAQALIDSSRKLAINFRHLLEIQAQLEGQVAYFENRASRGDAFDVVERIDGKPIFVFERRDNLRKTLANVENTIIHIRSTSPMLALMIPTERGVPESYGYFDKFSYWLGSNVVDIYEFITNDKQRTLYGENPVDASLFGQSPGAAADDAIRADFEKNIDAVRKAIRRARAEILLGNIDDLIQLPGLQQLVISDLAKNPSLNNKLAEILSMHSIEDIAWTIGEIAISVGALFLPGGVFISAAIGYGFAAKDMDKSFRQWDIAKAGAIDPARALIDQQESESQLVISALMLALSTIDLGSETIKGLKAIEVAGGLTKGRRAFGEASTEEYLITKYGKEIEGNPKLKADVEKARRIRNTGSVDEAEKLLSKTEHEVSVLGSQIVDTEKLTLREIDDELHYLVEKNLFKGEPPTGKLPNGKHQWVESSPGVFCRHSPGSFCIKGPADLRISSARKGLAGNAEFVINSLEKGGRSLKPEEKIAIRKAAKDKEWGLWALKPTLRGDVAHALMGENLYHSFPVIDIAKGARDHAREIRSIKTRSHLSYETGSAIEKGKLFEQIWHDAKNVSVFSFEQAGFMEVAAGPNTKRVLEVGLPPNYFTNADLKTAESTLLKLPPSKKAARAAAKAKIEEIRLFQSELATAQAAARKMRPPVEVIYTVIK